MLLLWVSSVCRRTLSLEVVVVLGYMVVGIDLGARGQRVDGGRLLATDATFDMLLVLEGVRVCLLRAGDLGCEVSS